MDRYYTTIYRAFEAAEEMARPPRDDRSVNAVGEGERDQKQDHDRHRSS